MVVSRGGSQALKTIAADGGELIALCRAFGNLGRPSSTLGVPSRTGSGGRRPRIPKDRSLGRLAALLVDRSGGSSLVRRGVPLRPILADRALLERSQGDALRHSRRGELQPDRAVLRGPRLRSARGADPRLST